MTRGAILVGGILVVVAAAGFYLSSRQPVSPDNEVVRRLAGSALNHRPSNRVRLAHYPVTSLITMPECPPPPGITFHASGRLSETMAGPVGTDWATPGLIPAVLERSLETFIRRAVLNEVSVQNMHKAGMIDRTQGFRNFVQTGMPGTGAFPQTLNVDANAEFSNPPRGYILPDKNIVTITVDGIGNSSTEFRIPLIPVSPKPPEPAKPSMPGFRGPNSAPIRVARNWQAPPGFTQDSTAKSIGIAAWFLTNQYMSQLAQQLNRRVNLVGSTACPPGLTVSYQGIMNTNSTGAPPIAPVDPAVYAAAVTKLIRSDMDQDRQMQRNSVIGGGSMGAIGGPAGQSTGVMASGQAGGRQNSVSKITITFPGMMDYRMSLANLPGGQLRNGAEVLRSQDKAIADAAARTEKAAIALNQWAARYAKTVDRKKS